MDEINIQIRQRQERMVAILEDVVQTAGEIDYTVLDELNSEQSDQAASLMSFLNSLELLCH